MEMDQNWLFYCNNNRGVSSIVEGISIPAIAMIQVDVQIIVGCQRYSLNVSVNCQKSQKAEIPGVALLSVIRACISLHLYPALSFIQSLIFLTENGSKRLKQWMNFLPIHYLSSVPVYCALGMRETSDKEGIWEG